MAVLCDVLSQPETALPQGLQIKGLIQDQLMKVLFTDLSEGWSRPNSKDVVY